LGSAIEESSSEPPNLEGLNPSQIEEIMIEQILTKPKGSGKEAFDFTKTVKPILESFKKQLLSEKAQMQKSLDSDIAAIKKCISKMKKKTKLGLLDLDKKKKKKRKNVQQKRK